MTKIIDKNDEVKFIIESKRKNVVFNIITGSIIYNCVKNFEFVENWYYLNAHWYPAYDKNNKYLGFYIGKQFIKKEEYKVKR